MSHAVTDGAAAWIHSREAENSDEVRVGTQSLFVDNSVLAQWQGGGGSNTNDTDPTDEPGGGTGGNSGGGSSTGGSETGDEEG